MLAMSLLGALLGLLGTAQDPRPDAAPAEATAKPLSDQAARAAIAEFNKLARDKKARLAQRVEAITALGEGQHALLVEPLAQAVQRDAALTVRTTAAKLLGHQPAKPARR